MLSPFLVRHKQPAGAGAHEPATRAELEPLHHRAIAAIRISCAACRRLVGPSHTATLRRAYYDRAASTLPAAAKAAPVAANRRRRVNPPGPRNPPALRPGFVRGSIDLEARGPGAAGCAEAQRPRDNEYPGHRLGCRLMALYGARPDAESAACVRRVEHGRASGSRH